LRPANPIAPFGCRGVTMTTPRLLVALRPHEEVGRILGERLPKVEWEHVAEGHPAHWEHVEALLLGSVERDLANAEVSSMPRLQFVQRVYTGMDGIPFERFPETVRFAGNVGAYAPFVAEHAVALALAAAREIPRAHALVRAGQLRPTPVQRLLWDRTAVILGYGEIGRAIAHRLSGFGTRVYGLNRTGRMAPGCLGMFPAERLREAVHEGDFVFDARPLTRSTAGTIDASVLAAMRAEAIFINVGRAGTVHEESLYRHLSENPGFRAALDVWWNEDFVRGRIEHRFPFADLPNFVGTPHSAGFGPGVESYVLERAVANLRRFFDGQEPRHLVDRTEYEGT
jgi:phosphoglycerate dehydrogenase-like enzyme